MNCIEAMNCVNLAQGKAIFDLFIEIFIVGIIVAIIIAGLLYRNGNFNSISTKQYPCYLCAKPEYEYMGKFINVKYGATPTWICKTCSSKIQKLTEVS